MDRSPNKKFSYGQLSPNKSFRILKLLPGSASDSVECVLLESKWPPEYKYEALSYAWGDPTTNQTIRCSGSNLGVTTSLYGALVHLRRPTRERLLWADAVCIDQSDSVERAEQIKQMKKIYENAESVLVWLGPDKDAKAKLAIDSIVAISKFLCDELGIEFSSLSSVRDIYQDVIFRNRARLPVPNKCPFSRGKDSAKAWDSLKWLYSHKYFTRVWVIQEINAHTTRSVHCGTHEVEWNRVELVAGYIIMDSAFSKTFGSSNTKCWWAANVSTERIRRPNNWLFTLYLASNFSSTDERDAIYGVLGLLTVPRGKGLLEPNYDKPVLEVYRDAVEAALHQFENTDVLLYVKEGRIPSWVPSWN
ncbi:HET domain-containing protein [Microdochium nivale]|nr:HET domain-containing protein [Microdochium nivale]